MADVALSLWTVLDMMGQIGTGDLITEYFFEQKIINDRLDPKRRGGIVSGYNPDIPGSFPIYVTPILVVDHVKALNEKEQVMVLSGGVIFMWNDPRLTWNISEYGGVQEISKSRTTLKAMNREPYLPKIHITELYSRTVDILRFDSTEVSISHEGYITVRTQIRVKTSCFFNFDEYPHDKQNCSFSLYSPDTIDKFSFNALGGAHKSPTLKAKSGFNSKLDVADFRILDIQGRRLHLLPRSVVIDNPDAFPKKIVRTVFWFNVIFERHYKYYFSKEALPLICISTVTFLVGLIQSYPGLIMLLLMTAVQFINGMSLVHSLPPDYVSMPLIGFMASLIFVQTALLILWRMAALGCGQTAPHLNKKIEIGENCVRVLIGLSYLLYTLKLLEVL